MSSALPETTLGNHFRFGYDGNYFVPRRATQERWFVEYGRCQSAPLPFREECFRTAQCIAERAGRQSLVVLLSGGVDSEVTLRAFAERGIPVSAAVMRFKDDLNVHDISHAVVACEKLGVRYRFYDLDILRFWEAEAHRYAEATQCISPQLVATMWLIDQIDGYPVMGSGECLLVKRLPADYVFERDGYPSSPWDLWEKERIAAWFRHFIVRGRNGCPSFFQFTPEIMLSFLCDPQVVRLVNDQLPPLRTTEAIKLAIYQRHFDLIPRKKYTGFERLQNEDAVLRAQLRSRFPASDEIVKTSYTDLVERLSPEAPKTSALHV